MPPLSKHKWLKLFQDLVQQDLCKVNWNWVGPNNLTEAERRALCELEEAPNLVIKKSDKRGNVVLLSETLYENESLRLLGDESTYKQLETGLLTNKEYYFLKAEDITITTFYIIHKLQKIAYLTP